jgi:hypothetical protein
MKTKQIQQFVAHCLIPELNGYSIVRKMLLQEPLTHILRGFYFEDSEFNPRSSYVSILVLPLYVPESHVHFQFGKRLYRKVGFLKAPPYNDRVCHSLLEAITSQGIPYLSKLATPGLIVRNLRHVTGLYGDPYVREAIAYSLARIGKLAAAKRRLQWLLRTVGRDSSRPFMRVVKPRRAFSTIGPSRLPTI